MFESEWSTPKANRNILASQGSNFSGVNSPVSQS